MIRNIRILYIHNFLVDFRILDAFRPIYFAQITGSYTLAMAVFSVAWITSSLVDIPTGVLSDKWDANLRLCWPRLVQRPALPRGLFPHTAPACFWTAYSAASANACLMATIMRSCM